jgi:cytochrome c2
MRRNELLGIAAAALGALLASGCGESVQRAAAAMTGGDPNRGAASIRRYGCGSCHIIRGITGAIGQVGPPLTGAGSRMYIAGVLENRPENLVRWIQDPKAVDEKTAMPKLGVSEQDATDIAAYIYSIK